MATFTTAIHVVTCFLIILVVLMQSGKGAEISSNLGGSSQTIFGNAGGNFFTKLTFGLATVFFVTSLILTMMSTQSKKSVFEGQVAPMSSTTSPVTGAAATGGAAAIPETASAPAKANASATKNAAPAAQSKTDAPAN